MKQANPINNMRRQTRNAEKPKPPKNKEKQEKKDAAALTVLPTLLIQTCPRNGYYATETEQAKGLAIVPTKN